MGEDQERQPSNFLRDFYEALRSGLQSSLPSLPNPTSPLAKEAMAHQDLQRAGSVMAKPKEPDWLKNNPLLGTIAQMTNLAGGLVDPVDMFGGKPLKVAGKLGLPAIIADALGLNQTGAGQSSQAGFGPIKTKAQKKIAKAIFRGDPETARAVRADPRILHLDAPSSYLPTDPLATSYGTYSNLRDIAKGGRLAINPATMKGRGPTTAIGDLPSTALHEATHFLNVPDLYRMSNKESYPLTKMIQEALPLNSRSMVERHLRNQGPMIGADEGLAYLAEAAAKGRKHPEMNSLQDAVILQDLLKVRAKPQGGKLARPGTGVARSSDLPEDPYTSGLMDVVMGPLKAAEPKGGLLEAILQETRHAKYRDLGRKRVTGEMKVKPFMELLRQEPDYEKFKNTAQRVARWSQKGKPLSVGRGMSDAELQAIIDKGLPSDMAVSSGFIPHSFAKRQRHMVRSPSHPNWQDPKSYVLGGEAPPEAITALLPRRETMAFENELILDPRLMEGWLEAQYGNQLRGAGANTYVDQVQEPVNSVLQQLVQELFRK